MREVFGLLNITIDPLLDEYLLQTGKVQFLLQFFLLDVQFHLQQALSLVRDVLQNVQHRDEVRLVAVHDDTGVGADGQFAVGKGVQRINRHVGADTRG